MRIIWYNCIKSLILLSYYFFKKYLTSKLTRLSNVAILFYKKYCSVRWIENKILSNLIYDKFLLRKVQSNYNNLSFYKELNGDMFVWLCVFVCLSFTVIIKIYKLAWDCKLEVTSKMLTNNFVKMLIIFFLTVCRSVCLSVCLSVYFNLTFCLFVYYLLFVFVHLSQAFFSLFVSVLCV